MGTLFAFVDWTLAGWFFFLLAILAGIVIGLIGLFFSRYKDGFTLVGCVLWLSAMAVVGIWIAEWDASEHTRKQQVRAEEQAYVDQLAAETEQAYADLTRQGFVDGFYRPTTLSVLEQSVTFAWPNCTLHLGLRRITDEYFVVLFPTDAIRPVTPSILPEVINLGCMQP